MKLSSIALYLTTAILSLQGQPVPQSDTRTSAEFPSDKVGQYLKAWFGKKAAKMKENAGPEGRTLWHFLDKNPGLKKEFVALSTNYNQQVYHNFNKLYEADAKAVEKYLPFAIAIAVDHGQFASFYTVYGKDKRPDILKAFQWFSQNAEHMNLPLDSSPIELLIHIADAPSLDIEAEANWALAHYGKDKRKVTGSYGHPPYRHLKGWIKKNGEENPNVIKYRENKKSIEHFPKHTLPHNLLDGGVCFHKSYYGTRILKYHGYASLWQAETNHAYVVGLYLDKNGIYQTNIQHNYGRMGGKNYSQKRGLGQKTTSDLVKMAAGLNRSRDSYIHASLAVRAFLAETDGQKSRKIDIIKWAIQTNPDAWSIFQELRHYIEGQTTIENWKEALNLARQASKIDKASANQKMLQSSIAKGICNQDLTHQQGQLRYQTWLNTSQRNVYTAAAVHMQLLNAHKLRKKAIAEAVKLLSNPTSDKKVDDVARELRLSFGKGKEGYQKAREVFDKLYVSLPHYSLNEPQKRKHGKATPNRAMQAVCSQYIQLIKKDKKSAALLNKIQATQKKLKKATKTKDIPKSATGEVSDPAYQRWLEEMQNN